MGRNGVIWQNIVHWLAKSAVVIREEKDKDADLDRKQDITGDTRFLLPENTDRTICWASGL